jgi:hypothetical protein
MNMMMMMMMMMMMKPKKVLKIVEKEFGRSVLHYVLYEVLLC